MKKIILGLCVCLIVSSCGWLGIRDRTSDYLLAEETAPTVVPAELNSIKLGQAYPIPSIGNEAVTEGAYEVPRPQPISVNTFEQLVKIQSIDDKRWILVNSSPSELWPRVRNALNRNGVPAARAEGSEGIIETIWLNYTSDDENSHRFRLLVAPGVQTNSTEISALHQQKVRGSEVSDWPDLSDNLVREKDMLSLIANQLASETDYGSVSLLAQGIGGESKVEIIKPEVADPYILVKLDFDRTWASISYSASRGGFITIDKNRSKGIFLVNYSSQIEDEEGFFKRWFGGNSESETIEANYQILVQKVGVNVEVRIVTADGDSLRAAQALELLSVLRGNMS
jgi:outer membrane protein assembly factor BamC